MIALNNEDIPLKQDTQSESHNDELTMENPSLPEVDSSETTKETETATSTANTNKTATAKLNIQFQQKTKYIREMWSQHRVKLDKGHSQLLFICVLTAFGIICSMASLLTNYWISDSMSHVNFGLWNTCWQEKYSFALEEEEEQNKTMPIIEAANETQVQSLKWLCARQGIYSVAVNPAEKWHVDQVFASQGLLVAGTVMYGLSVVMLSLAYRFINMNRLNLVRNTLVTAMFAQMLAFLMQLIGYFLFIFTDRATISIALLFVYFGLTIFATNIINFITIEYKAYKTRQMTI
jgi:hypothetical protein